MTTFLAVLACAAGAVQGCGDDGSEGARIRAKADADLVAEIEASAKRHAAERDRDLAAPAPASATTTPAVEARSRPGEAEAAGPATPTRTSPALLSSADRASFARLAQQLPGEEGIAVTTLGRAHPLWGVGTLRTGVAWSTAKVPVAMAAIRAGVAKRRDLVQAITASDNAASERLWSALGNGERAASAATAQVRAAGDEKTQIQSQRLREGYTAFGQTQWALSDQARFVAGMRCTAPGRDVLALMNEVVADQRWGLGSAGTPAQFKAGWGPGVNAGSGDGWLDRQMGIAKIGGRPIAVAMATTAPGHDTGTQSLTAIARWLVTHVNARGAPRSPRC